MIILTKKINWQPEHFPVGTVVSLERYRRDEDGKPTYAYDDTSTPAEVRVTEVIQNGADSYLIRTDEFNFSLNLYHSFNFDHVGSIIKRGDGPLKVQYLGKSTRMPNLKEDISGRLLNKNKYYFYYAPEFIRHLVSLSKLPKNLIIKDSFTDFFLNQSFVKKEGGAELWCPLYHVDKKKARRFIQQNINRWIAPMKEVRAAVEREDKREREQYYRELDREFDREYGADTSAEKEEPCSSEVPVSHPVLG